MGFINSKQTSYCTRRADSFTKHPFSVDRNWTQHRGFQEDYQAWLRSLPHLEAEEEDIRKRRKSNQHSSRKAKQNRTLFEKISSLFRSKKHREPCIAWPDITPNEPPPKIRLSFNTNNPRLQELQKQKRQRKSLSSLQEQDFRRSNERKKVFLSTHQNSHDRSFAENEMVFWDFQSGGIPYHYFDNSNISPEEFNAYCSSQKIRRSIDRLSNMSSHQRSSVESITAKHNRTASSHSSEENAHNRQYHWDIPVDYNAVQGSASLIGPRVLPPYRPGQRQALHNTHEPSPILSQRSSSSSRSSHVSAIVNQHYQPSVNDVIEEVQDNFRRQFSTNSSTSASSSSKYRKRDFPELPEYYANENAVRTHDFKSEKLPNVGRNRMHDINIGELRERQKHINAYHQNNALFDDHIPHPSAIYDPRNDHDFSSRTDISPSELFTKKDDDFSPYINVESHDDVESYKRDVDFGPGSENFYLVSTPEHSWHRGVKDKSSSKNMSRTRSGIELNDQQRTREDAEFRTVSAVIRNREGGSPSNRLWRNSNPIVSSLNSLQDPNFSPYQSTSDLKALPYTEQNHPEFVPTPQEQVFHHNDNYRSHNGASDSTAYYDTGSVADNTSDSGSMFTSPRGTSRVHDRRHHSRQGRRRHKKKTRQQRNEHPNLEPRRFDIGLEQKINEMVMGFMGESMDPPTSEDHHRRKKSRKGRNLNYAGSDGSEARVSSDQIQEMLERQLATALTKIFVPKSPLNRD